MLITVTLHPDPEGRTVDGAPRCYPMTSKMLGLHLTGNSATVISLIPRAMCALAGHNWFNQKPFHAKVLQLSIRRRFFLGLRDCITNVAHKDWVSEKWHDRLEFVAYRFVDPLIWL